MSNHSMIRITKELSGIQKSSDLSLAVACRDVDVRHVKALIVGPSDSPYEFGFFEFNVKFPKEYPGKPPSVVATTTNGGRCRFGPNIYAMGKVCLSILGTWRGERGEEWSSAQGLESILISIQSLMSQNPYENEPGFEDANSAEDKKNMKAYVEKIRHETLRISVIQRMENLLNIKWTGNSKSLQQHERSSAIEDPSETEDFVTAGGDDSDTETNFRASWEPFRDLYKRRFLWYYDSYLASITKYKADVKDGQAFTRMPFEGCGNDMPGKFNYTELERRLKGVKTFLDREVQTWVKDGAAATKESTSLAVNMKRQFEQVVEHYKRIGSVTLDLELVDGNVFEWALTYFGRPMTNLDGGLFRIKLYFSQKFPEEQPRAKFETDIFHHRIATDGTPCYIVNRSDFQRNEDIKQHIDAIIDALEEENPPYDPRTNANPEAAKLYWGTAEDRKSYHRRLRRTVQRSVEE